LFSVLVQLLIVLFLLFAFVFLSHTVVVVLAVVGLLLPVWISVLFWVFVEEELLLECSIETKPKKEKDKARNREM
jgi:hypothetical protein